MTSAIPAAERADDDLLHRISSQARAIASYIEDNKVSPEQVIHELTRLSAIAGKGTDPLSTDIQASIASDIHDYATGEIDKDQILTTLKQASAQAQAGYASQLTYEGADRRDMEDYVRRGFHLPGEQVRIDPISNVTGVDRDALAAQLGDDPLTITKTIVRGVDEDNRVGGINRVAYIEYEFDGVEGRHNAQSFMPEVGRGHAYGVALGREDRLWLVPLSSDLDNPTIAGPVREIIGFTGRNQDEIHPGGYDVFKNELAHDATTGEFYFHNQLFGATKEPVHLVASPWSTVTMPAEYELAAQAVDKYIAQERTMAVQSLTKGPQAHAEPTMPMSHTASQER